MSIHNTIKSTNSDLIACYPAIFNKRHWSQMCESGCTIVAYFSFFGAFAFYLAGTDWMWKIAVVVCLSSTVMDYVSRSRIRNDERKLARSLPEEKKNELAKELRDFHLSSQIDSWMKGYDKNVHIENLKNENRKYAMKLLSSGNEVIEGIKWTIGPDGLSSLLSRMDRDALLKIAIDEQERNEIELKRRLEQL